MIKRMMGSVKAQRCRSFGLRAPLGSSRSGFALDCVEQLRHHLAKGSPALGLCARPAWTAAWTSTGLGSAAPTHDHAEPRHRLQRT
jgi:hypothetical protein